MPLVKSRARSRPPVRAVAALGMFDGVHIGHQRLIGAAVAEARRLRGTSVVVTFEPDPQHILNPARASAPLLPLEARVAAIRALGAQRVLVIPFTRRFANTTAGAFVQTVLARRLRAHCVVVGRGFVFGHDRQGNLATLRTLGRRAGYRVIAVPPVRRDGAVVSSSRIRALVRSGEVVNAARLLGRPPTLYGTVVRGAGRATALGFPTANLRLAKQLPPESGVYGVRLHRAGRSWPGVMNLGRRPTFGAGPLTCEAHLLGFRGSLYGTAVRVEVLQRLRPEQRFASVDALVDQIHRDIAVARLIPLQ
jgi:riboflavin kinase/FMN adenylyltransferase